MERAASDSESSSSGRRELSASCNSEKPEIDLVDSALEPVFAPLDNFDVLYTGARLDF